MTLRDKDLATRRAEEWWRTPGTRSLMLMVVPMLLVLGLSAGMNPVVKVLVVFGIMSVVFLCEYAAGRDQWAADYGGDMSLVLIGAVLAVTACAATGLRTWGTLTAPLTTRGRFYRVFRMVVVLILLVIIVQADDHLREQTDTEPSLTGFYRPRFPLYAMLAVLLTWFATSGIAGPVGGDSRHAALWPFLVLLLATPQMCPGRDRQRLMYTIVGLVLVGVFAPVAVWRKRADLRNWWGARVATTATSPAAAAV